MRKKPFKQGIALGAMCVLSVGIIFAADMARGPKASAEIGQAFDISGLEAEAYKVSKVRVLDDGSYVVYGSTRGFQSNIETAVTFDEAGDKILSLEIVAQDETGGIGTKITEEAFLSQFSDIQAPVKIADLEIKSPVTDAVEEDVNATEIDGISGATVSSEAVGKTINNGYFFLQEQIKK